jgi:hypothetical protein
MVLSRITSLIYINFDELERIPVQSWRNERALNQSGDMSLQPAYSNDSNLVSIYLQPACSKHPSIRIWPASTTGLPQTP